jgi:hypothetical protein
MDMPNDILRDAREALEEEPTRPYFRTSREFGRYATRVRINAAHGSSFNGRTGHVADVRDGVPFVRIQIGDTHSLTIPFGFADLEVLP